MNDLDISTPSQHTLNFTIFLKNFIVFKYFNLDRSNIAMDPSYLKKCNYHPVDHPLCPIFRIRTLLDIVELDPDERRLMLQYGGIIHINIDWFCNLDRGLNRCLPHYAFKRLDIPFKQQPFSEGFGFR
jgi:hypothetical protein